VLQPGAVQFLGAVVRGIWSYFATWLNILGVIVPPIGIIIILDQLVFARRRSLAGPGMYWKPFAAWAVGAGVALVAHYNAPELSESIVAILAGAIAFAALTFLPGGAPAVDAQPALKGESA
jgi:cytosine permease